LEIVGLAEKLPKINRVKQPKQEDVWCLSKSFTIPPEAKDVYDDIFKEDKTTTKMLDEDCQQYDEDEVIN